MFTMVLKCFQMFLQVFQMHVSSVSSVFFCIFLQVLHLDILKVNRMLHIGYAWEAGGGASGTHAGDVRANNNFRFKAVTLKSISWRGAPVWNWHVGS
jgi:hypothetical protein